MSSALSGALVSAEYIRTDLASLDEIVLPGAFGGLGNPVFVTVPGAFWYRFRSFKLSVSTGNVAGVRVPQLQIVDPSSNVVVTLPAIAGQNPALTNTYFWFPQAGSAYGTVDQPQIMPFPDMMIPSGWKLQVAMSTPLISDQVGPSVFVYERYPTGPPLSYESSLTARPLSAAELIGAGT